MYNFLKKKKLHHAILFQLVPQFCQPPSTIPAVVQQQLQRIHPLVQFFQRRTPKRHAITGFKQHGEHFLFAVLVDRRHQCRAVKRSRVVRGRHQPHFQTFEIFRHPQPPWFTRRLIDHGAALSVTYLRAHLQQLWQRCILWISVWPFFYAMHLVIFLWLLIILNHVVTAQYLIQPHLFLFC